MRTFALHRDEDVSGVSGTGRVAEGVEFSDGTVVLRWLTRTGSVAVYLNGADMEKVHGHDGRTRVVWDGPGPSSPTEDRSEKCEWCGGSGTVHECSHSRCHGSGSSDHREERHG